MILEESKTMKITKGKAEGRKVSSKSGFVYDAFKSELSFKVNKCSGKGFRLVYNDEGVITIIDGTDKDRTGTIHKIEEFKTMEEVDTRIEKLGLKQEEEIWL